MAGSSNARAFLFSPVSKAASDEIGQNNGGLVRLQEPFRFAWVGQCDMEQSWEAVVLPNLPGKGQCGKEASLMT